MSSICFSRRLRGILAAGLSCLFLAWPAGLGYSAQNIDQHRLNLEQLRSRIDQIGRNLDRKQAAEFSLAGDLEAVEKEEARLEEKIGQMSRSLDESRHRLGGLEEREEELKRKIRDQEAEAKTRLRAMYKGYGGELWQILFSRVSPVQKAEDLFYLQHIVRHDRSLIDGYRGSLRDLAETTDTIRKLRDTQARQLADMESHRRTLEKARHLKKRLIARIQEERTGLQAELSAMKTRERELESLIKRLETENAREYIQNTGYFSRQRGQLPWPAAGEIRTRFGTYRHPELGTLYESQGIEIAAGNQQPVKAVGEGRVVFANPLKGYGNLVIIDHGDSYHSLYARVDRVVKKVGDRVSAGEAVAFSGTGSEAGIYFEIRHHGKPLDPASWLKPR